MPYREPDPSDPSMLVGVVLPGGEESVREMAAVFADEFARMGTPRERILELFRNPFYAGPHGALRALGAEAIRELVDEAAARWPAVRVIDAPGAADDDDEATLRLAEEDE